MARSGLLELETVENKKAFCKALRALRGGALQNFYFYPIVISTKRSAWRDLQ
jgi:hypothetical protein